MALRNRELLAPIIISYIYGIGVGIVVFRNKTRRKHLSRGQVGVGLPYVILAIIVITSLFIATSIRLYTEVSSEPILTVKARIVNLTTTTPYYCLVLNIENIHGKTANYYKLVFSNGTRLFIANNTAIVDNSTGSIAGTVSLSKNSVMEGETMVIEACMNTKLTEAYGGVIFDRVTLVFRARYGE